MIVLTPGIVLRRIKYGDSSQIVHIFTKRFGLQSCMIKGLGKGRRGSSLGNLLFPASLVDLGIYYQEGKNIKLIKEVQPLIIYQSLGENVLKNAVAIFAMEVLQNLLIADDVQLELFGFCHQFLIQLDAANDRTIGNYPLYFLVQAGRLSGYQILGAYGEDTPFLNLENGTFTRDESLQTSGLFSESIEIMSRINLSSSLEEILLVKMTHDMRKLVLKQFLQFFEIHFPHFRPLKSVAVLSEILS